MLWGPQCGRGYVALSLIFTYGRVCAAIGLLCALESPIQQGLCSRLGPLCSGLPNGSVLGIYPLKKKINSNAFFLGGGRTSALFLLNPGCICFI